MTLTIGGLGAAFASVRGRRAVNDPATSAKDAEAPSTWGTHREPASAGLAGVAGGLSLRSRQEDHLPAPECGTWAIHTTDLTRRFGLSAALRGVDLRVGWGERVALVGANGAGKTTLLRILATLTRPSAGNVAVAGEDLADTAAAERARRRVGFAGHQTYLYDDLTVAENLAFYARLYGHPADPEAHERLLRRCGLWERRRDRVRALSRGLQQRCSLARALLHDPPILLLDEPDAGLDAQGLDWLGEIVADSRRTVVLTTHAPDRARAWCQRTVVLSGGRKTYDGPPDAWTHSGDTDGSITR